MTALADDLRSAFRSLSRHPLSALGVILMLALGMGASTAIFSVIRGVLLRPLSFSESHRIVAVPARTDGGGWEISWPNFVDLSAAPAFQNAAVYLRSAMFLMEGEDPQLLYGVEASPTIFDILRVRPIVGRTFTAAEDREGAERVVVISHELWTTGFGSDPNILGRSMRISSRDGNRTIIGVMPAGFRFPVIGDRSDYYIPIGPGITEQARQRRDVHFMTMIARLRNGVSAEQAQSEVEAISRRLEQQFPATNRDLRYDVIPYREWITGDVRAPLWVLLGGVGAVLLIACANIANLLLGRAVGRMGEFAVRSALGAAYSRIARQLLAESLFLGLSAAALGLVIGRAALAALRRLAPADLPRMDAVSMDPLVFGFAIALAILTSVLFGFAPAMAMSRWDLVSSLRAAAHRGSTEGRRANAFRRGLVIAEIALSLLLLVSAGLMIRSFWHLIHLDPGYDTKDAVSVHLSARSVHETDAQVVEFFRDLISRLRVVPGFKDVTATRILPFHYTNLAFDFRVHGHSFDPSTPPQGAAFGIVTPGYFQSMRIRMLRGREFNDRDDARSVPVVVVSASLAREQFGIGSAIGQKLVFESDGSVREIIGVVSDIREADRSRPPVPAMYVPHAQQPQRAMRVLVRTGMDPATASGLIRRVIRDMDRLQPIVRIESFENVQSAALAKRRLALALLSSLAGLAFVLAGVGIYSVMAYMVAQRRGEIAVRMALGASSRHIARMILTQSAALFAAGGVLGVLGSMAMRQLLQKFVFGVNPADPVTFGFIVALLGVVALLAGWLPARRAGRVDPLVALRAE